MSAATDDSLESFATESSLVRSAIAAEAAHDGKLNHSSLEAS